MVVKFEVGKSYEMRSPCDVECIWKFEVLSRTASTVTILNGSRVQTVRVAKNETEWNQAETVFPLGRHSMAPCLRASKVVS